MNSKKSINRTYVPSIWGIFFNPVFIARFFLFRKLKKFFSYLRGDVMDFGCGVSPYRPFIHCEKYYRVDFEKTFQVVDDRQDEIIFYNGKDIPMSDASLDGVLSTEVLEHVPEADEIVREFRRVLKKGGYVLISVPFAWGEHDPPYDFRRLTSYGLRYLFEKHGFKVLHVEKATNTIHTITQLISAEIRNRILPGIPVVKQLLNLIFIFPIQIIGLIIGFIIPDKRKILPLNLVLLAVKDCD